MLLLPWCFFTDGQNRYFQIWDAKAMFISRRISTDGNTSSVFTTYLLYYMKDWIFQGGLWNYELYMEFNKIVQVKHYMNSLSYTWICVVEVWDKTPTLDSSQYILKSVICRYIHALGALCVHVHIYTHFVTCYIYEFESRCSDVYHIHIKADTIHIC